MSVPENIDLSTGEVVDVMSETEARDLTERINSSAHDLRKLLVEAHERKAWSALGYRTFEEWVEAELRMGKSHAYRLIEHESTLKALQTASPIGDAIDVRLLPNEAQSRVLSGRFKDDTGELDKDAVAKAWQQAVQRSDGRPTAAVVREVAEEMRPSPPVEPKPSRPITVVDDAGSDDGWEYPAVDVQPADAALPPVVGEETGSIAGLSEAEMLERLAIKIDASWSTFSESARVSCKRSVRRLAERINKDAAKVTPIAKGKKGR